MAKKVVIDIGVLSGNKTVRFAPEGDSSWFRRYLRPYGKCSRRHGARSRSRDSRSMVSARKATAEEQRIYESE